MTVKGVTIDDMGLITHNVYVILHLSAFIVHECCATVMIGCFLKHIKVFFIILYFVLFYIFTESNTIIYEGFITLTLLYLLVLVAECPSPVNVNSTRE